MKVWIRGEGAVNLSQRNFVGQGGQASIYAKGDVALKIYGDPSKMIAEGKLRELSALSAANIIRPEKIVCDKDGRAIGYSMRYLRDTHALCQLFPRSFRERNAVSAAQIGRLVDALRIGLQHIHSAGILAVDLNEMNLLVDRSFDQLYFIDVDSYQTPSYSADAIMESIRDRHAPANAFTPLTDWFAFAVVSFQLFVGIHPFKGKHPVLQGLDARMQANVSVLSPAVRVPRAAYPLSIIPAPMLHWYQAIFERGERMPPPLATGQSFYVPSVRKLSGRGLLHIEKIASLDGAVLGVWSHHGHVVVATDRGVWLDARRVADSADTRGIAFTPRLGSAIAVADSDRGPVLTNLSTRQNIPFATQGSDVTGYDGRVYFKSSDTILELVLTELGNKVVASTRVAASIAPKAAQLFPGVVVQCLMGTSYVSLFPSAGVAHQQHLEALDEYRVVDAKFDAGVLMIMARPKGKERHRFDRLIYRFSPDYRHWDLRIVKDVVQAGLNFVVLDTGVCISLREDDKIEIFHARMGSVGVKVIDDELAGSDIALVKRPGQLLFAQGKELYSMSMR